MTTASNPEWSLPLTLARHHFLFRRLHSLTGILFGGYIVVHLLINATIAQGGNVYQTQVNKIHDLPFLGLLEWVLIYLPILYHTVYGIWITVTGQPNVYNYPFARNVFYLMQRISAVVLVIFIAFHVLSLKYGWFSETLRFDPHRAMASIGRHMDVSAFVTFGLYPLGILAGCFHLANGFFTAAVTWGLAVSAPAQRRWGLVCIGIFAITLAAGLAALVAAMRVR